MDILNQTANTDDNVDVIADLSGDSVVNPRIPQNAIKSRAALTAMLTSAPESVIDDYRRTVQDFNEGRDDTISNFIQQNKLQQQDVAKQHFISMLSDPNIPLEKKRKMMTFIQNNDFVEDPSTTLAVKTLAKDNPGEDAKGESARISLADTMAGLEAERQERQKLSNNIGARLPDASFGTIAEVAEAEYMPFGRNVIAANLAQELRKQTGVPSGMLQWIKDFALPGTTRKEIMETMQKIPLDKRAAYAQSLVQAIQDSKAVFPGQNYYSKYKLATEMLERDYMTTEEAWTENMMTLLDLFAVGSTANSLIKSRRGAQAGSGSSAAGTGAQPEDIPRPKQEQAQKASWELVEDPVITNPYQIGPQRPRITNKKMNDAIEHAEKNAVMRRENPESPFSIVEQVNPDQSRKMYDMMVKSGDEVSEALTGVSKEQALANGIYPQRATESGTVLNKVDQTLRDAANESGALRYTQSEFQSGIAQVTNNFRNTTGIQMNVPMTTFKTEGDHLVVSGHYGTMGGNFDNAEAALKQTKFALRSTGVMDNEITIMKRDGMDFVPVENIATAGPGEYMARVDMRVPITDADITDWSNLGVRWNTADRLRVLGSERKGSVTGWLFDPGSRFDPVLSGSMAVSVDRGTYFGNMLLRPIKEFRERLDKLPIDRRAKIDEYVIEANMNALPFDANNLFSRGFSRDEVEALKHWKEIWDNHYYLENLDMVRTLRNTSYQVLETKNNKFFARPVAKNQNIGQVYDPTMDRVRTLSQSEMNQLYDSGGSYAALRRPVTIDGFEVSHIVARNNVDEHLRAIRDTDQVLNYRDGYFTLRYKAPRFVEEEILVNGNVQKRVVAVAGSTEDADNFIAAAKAADPTRNLSARGDLKNRNIDAFDDNWDIQHSAGRIAQRVRGEPLVQAIGNNILGKPEVIVNPMESATIAARSIAGRTMERNAIETAKQRFIAQYGDLLPTVQGRKVFPSHRDQIMDKAGDSTKLAADARDTYNYIRFMENGYVNNIDEIYKAALHGVADIFGRAHLSTLERGATRAAEASPTNIMKSTAFQAYIAFDIPFRQWLVQGYQATRITALNPTGVINGGIGNRMMAYFGKQFEMEGSKEAKAFVEFVEKSGMMDGVDRNSLVRGMSLSMADASSKGVRAVGSVLAAPQKLGFELGEKLNVLSHLASVHEKFTRQGRNLSDLTVREEAWSEARALLLDLNRAGEYAYTNATPAVLMQFMQVPHKSFQQLTNRRIPTAEKIRLFTWDTMAWGVATAPVVAMLQAALDGPVLPEDPELAEALEDGVTNLLYNAAINSIYQEDERKTAIDFSPLSPYGLDGLTRMLSAFNDGGPMAALATSPGGQLIARNGVNGATKDGRITSAVLTMARYFKVVDEIDPENPTKYNAVVNDVLKVTSGWNRVDQFLIANEHRKKLDARGGVVQSDLTMPEVWATLLGMNTQHVSKLYETSQEVRKFTKERKDETDRKYRDMMVYLKGQVGSGTFDQEHVQAALSLMMRTFQSREELEYVYNKWEQDMMGPESGLVVQLWKAAGMRDSQELIDKIRRAPIDEEKKRMILQTIENTQRINEYEKERNAK